MDFAKLQKVIQYFQTFISCPDCKAKFAASGIYVVITIDNAGILMVCCKKCHFTALANFSLTRRGPKKEEFINIRLEAKTRLVSVNDVIDVHNFLKNFQGDLRELLTE